MEYNFIGYGSLLSEKSLMEILPRKKFVFVFIKNYKRIFNLKNYKSRYSDVLNLVKSKKSFFNAVMFKVNEDELRRICSREPEYNLEEVDYYNLLDPEMMHYKLRPVKPKFSEL